MPCIRCSKPPRSEPHHIQNTGRKLLEINDMRNLLPVCRACHTWVHKQGRTTSAKKCPAIRKFMIDNEWEFVPYLNKWLPPDFNC